MVIERRTSESHYVDNVSNYVCLIVLLCVVFHIVRRRRETKTVADISCAVHGNNCSATREIESSEGRRVPIVGGLIAGT
jgi:hypothetical protein